MPLLVYTTPKEVTRFRALIPRLPQRRFSCTIDTPLHRAALGRRTDVREVWGPYELTEVPASADQCMEDKRLK